MEDEQASYLQKAEVYDLMAGGREDAILSMGTKAIPGLVSILKNGGDWRKPIAIAILEKIDGPQSVRALKAATKDEDSGIRMLAVNALAKKGGKAAEKAIKDMRGDPSAQIGMNAEVLLLRRKSAATAPAAVKPMEKKVKGRVGRP